MTVNDTGLSDSLLGLFSRIRCIGVTFPTPEGDDMQELNVDRMWEQFHKTRNSQYRNLLMEHYRG